MKFKNLILLSLLGFGSTHCGSKASADTGMNIDGSSKEAVYVAKLDWQTPLKSETALTAKLSFTGPDGSAAQTVENIVFTPWMPTMGHGTSTVNQKISLVPGTTNIYLVEGIYFIMGGDWEIRLTATGNGRKDSANLPVYLP